MELGNKIALLRGKAKLTQKELAELLCISAQSVSKWENLVAMPDITLLPKLSEIFGVSIDELFDLTTEQKLNRIENRLDIERDFSHETFSEYENYLKSLLDNKEYHNRATGLLAQLYGRRMLTDSEKVNKYAEEAIRLNPGKKDCQWLLTKFNGHTCWDWNLANHSAAIEFYRDIVNENKNTGLPYLYLIDNLIADNRADEAEKYINEYAKLKDSNQLLVDIYKVYVVWIRNGGETSDQLLESLTDKYKDDSAFLFEAAQYYAKRAKYDKTIEYYEESFIKEPRKPRYIDALQAIAEIYAIMGDYQKAAETYDRVIICQKEEWGMSEEFELKDSERIKQEYLLKAKKQAK